jgi:hypothetical protein
LLLTAPLHLWVLLIDFHQFHARLLQFGLRFQGVQRHNKIIQVLRQLIVDPCNWESSVAFHIGNVVNRGVDLALQNLGQPRQVLFIAACLGLEGVTSLRVVSLSLLGFDLQLLHGHL